MIMMKLLIKTNTMNRISFKLKFRPSINPNKEGALYIQMIYQRKVRRIQTEYLIFNNEWDDSTGNIILPSYDSPRYTSVNCLKTNIEWELLHLRKTAVELERSNIQWSVDEILSKLLPSIPTGLSVFTFMRSLIQHKKKLGKYVRVKLIRLHSVVLRFSEKVGTLVLKWLIQN